MNRGKFDRLVTFSRATVTTDDHGGEVSTFAPLQQGWARVRFGSAQEKREAAQETSEQTATFEFVPTEALRGVTARDQIFLHEDESTWDIQGPGERLDRNNIRFTATRSL